MWHLLHISEHSASAHLQGIAKKESARVRSTSAGEDGCMVKVTSVLMCHVMLRLVSRTSCPAATLELVRLLSSTVQHDTQQKGH